jgi:hypothetical protein
LRAALDGLVDAFLEDAAVIVFMLGVAMTAVTMNGQLPCLDPACSCPPDILCAEITP